MTKIRSLKNELFLRLVVPLILFVFLDIVMTYGLTLHYVNETYDRWLLDSAKSLAQEISVQDGKMVVELPQAALAIFQWDEVDKTYFKVMTATRELLAGDASVPDFKIQTGGSPHPVFFEAELHGEPVRVVSMRIDRDDTEAKIGVSVAETLNKRRTMMRDIFLADLVPQILLVVLMAAYLLKGLKKGLQPLHAVAKVIAQRSPQDLEPIPETQVFLEVQSLTNTINRLFARLEMSIASQQRFIANAAHQLRTPLAGLKLQAERAQREQDMAAMKPALAQIQDCADRLSHMITQLLVLAKSEPIAGSYELKPVNLGLLVREVCMEWAPKALHKRMDLSYEGPDRLVYVNGDKILLGELLANLLDNAIAYGTEHGSISVKLEAQPAPRLIVEDDGPGIAGHELDKVFERFYRIPGNQSAGCGLGLAIVKEIADLHKARIEMSRIGDQGGTRIELNFVNDTKGQLF